MPHRRVLCIWFPRLGAERLLRIERATLERPFATIDDVGNAQIVASVSALAQTRGVQTGQPVRDAHAVCADLVTRKRNAPAEAAFLTVLRRWAGKFSPWVAEQSPDGLAIDLTGCAHLFGGEEALMSIVDADCADLGLTVRTGIADTLGAAWALARYAGQSGAHHRSGDAIDQEARATRSRAAKRRRWERGGTAPSTVLRTADTVQRIAEPGKTHTALSGLPVAALRLEETQVAELARLGLRRIGDLAGQPRAGLARRFGKGLVLRLDQAFGSTPEPISPARAPLHFAVRMTLPDPIGLEQDVQAGVDRLLPRLCARLRKHGRGARHVRLQAFRTDHTMDMCEIVLARASDEPERLRSLLAMKLGALDAGFGIDMLRLDAVQTEADPCVPGEFRWRGRTLTVTRAQGPERIAPEWWLDEPDWRTGVRDYWRVQTAQCDRLWLYFAHGGSMSAGWFCHGTFA